MEVVDGQTIVDYSEQNELSSVEWLQLLIDAADLRWWTPIHCGRASAISSGKPTGQKYRQVKFC